MLAALLIGVYAIPYAVRVRTLSARGRPVPAWRIWCFGAGLVVLVVAVRTPVLDLAG